MHLDLLSIPQSGGKNVKSFLLLIQTFSVSLSLQQTEKTTVTQQVSPTKKINISLSAFFAPEKDVRLILRGVVTAGYTV